MGMRQWRRRLRRLLRHVAEQEPFDVAFREATGQDLARFEAARPGRYRVGVSYDRACGLRRDPAGFEIRIEADGVRLERSGEVQPGEFEHIVIEFDLPPIPDA